MRPLLWTMVLAVLVVGCTATGATEFEPGVTPVAGTEVSGLPGLGIQFGELQKGGDYTYGPTVEEVITVYNCDNPLGRSDVLTEVRKIRRTIDWSVGGEVGASVEASIIAAGAEVEATISSGYGLEVGEELDRGRQLDLPVGPFSSADYVVVYKPVVWSGYLPFTYQSGESRIDYLYQQVAFGEVRGYSNQTERDCGRFQIPTESAPPAAQTTPVEAPQVEAETDPSPEAPASVPPTSSAPSEPSAPVSEPLWTESNNEAAANTTQIVRDLAAGEWMYVTSGSISMRDSFCGGEALQICVLLYEATYPQNVVVDYVDQGHAYVARTRLMGYQELIETHESYYWAAPNCGQDGCQKATILYFKDGVQVNNPVTLLRP